MATTLSSSEGTSSSDSSTSPSRTTNRIVEARERELTSEPKNKDNVAGPPQAKPHLPDLDRPETESSAKKRTELEDKFQKKGSSYHFRDNPDVVAFQERKYRATPALTTKHSANELVVRAMVEVSLQKHWKEIEVQGTSEFKRLAWIEANARGLGVKGYEPSIDDMQASKRRLESINRGAIETNPQQPSNGAQKVEPRQVMNRAEISGQVVELGTAPYKHQQGESPSYYVSLRERDGSLTTVWGKDLERAAKAIDLKVGDTVKSIEQTGKKPVTVQANVRNEKGEIVATEPRETNLNRWEIKKEPREHSLSPTQHAVIEAAAQRAPEDVRRQVRDVATERIIELAHNGKVPAVKIYDNTAPSITPRVPREPVQPARAPTRSIAR